MTANTNITPRQFSSAKEIFLLMIHNTSGVNLYIDTQFDERTKETGIPILPNEKFIQEWVGDLFIGADNDGTQFRIVKTPRLTTPIRRII